jgi:hypothetical protein
VTDNYLPTSTTAGFLDRRLPPLARALLIGVFALVPLAYFFKQYAQRPDLTQIIQFGETFEPHLLPEVKALQPDIHTLGGYDGQFYAQIALDPTLRRPDLPAALDDPGTRMQRPFLPALAYTLGWGHPAAILFDYALLNLAFWFLLLAGLVRRLPVTTLRSFLALFAILFSVGTLSSLECALTDLPATTLGYLALADGEIMAAPLIALAILTKPTMGLFLFRYVVPPKTPGGWKRRLLLVLLAAVPFVLWQLYLFYAFSVRLLAERQLGLPFLAWWHHVATSFPIFLHDPYPKLDQLPWRSASFEFLSALSLAIQALFFLLRPRWRQPACWIGLGFSALFFCLGPNPAGDELTYARSVLPLTLLFNIQLLELRQTWWFPGLYLAGNLGLLEGLRQTFRFLAS